MMEDSTINFLLIEDDEVDVMNVKRAFKKNNILNPLYFADDGLEALAMLRGNLAGSPVIPINKLLILLDLNMPKMSGIEFLQELRADSSLKRIPVVVLTTSNHEQDRFKAYQFNVAGYIIKPAIFNDFVEKMAALNKYWTFCEIP